MAEPITIAQLIDASEDAQTLALFSNADAATQVPRRLADPIETLEYWRNYMSALTKGADGATGAKGLDGSFSQKAYTTEALMIADKANIPANTSVSVTNDATSAKNGMYAYNGTAFTKSVYDPVTLAATDATTKANNAKTQAVADSKIYTDAATLPALVMSTTDVTRAQSGKSISEYLEGGVGLVPTTNPEQLISAPLSKYTGASDPTLIAGRVANTLLVENVSPFKICEIIIPANVATIKRFNLKTIVNYVILTSTNVFITGGRTNYADGEPLPANAYKIRFTAVFDDPLLNQDFTTNNVEFVVAKQGLLSNKYLRKNDVAPLTAKPSIKQTAYLYSALPAFSNAVPTATMYTNYDPVLFTGHVSSNGVIAQNTAAISARISIPRGVTHVEVRSKAFLYSSFLTNANQVVSGTAGFLSESLQSVPATARFILVGINNSAVISNLADDNIVFYYENPHYILNSALGKQLINEVLSEKETTTGSYGKIMLAKNQYTIDNLDFRVYPSSLFSGFCPTINFSIELAGEVLNKGHFSKIVQAGQLEVAVYDTKRNLIEKKAVVIHKKPMPTILNKTATTANKLQALFIGDSLIHNNQNLIGKEWLRMLNTNAPTETTVGNVIYPTTFNLGNGNIELVGNFGAATQKYEIGNKLSILKTGTGVVGNTSGNPFYNPNSTEPNEIGTDGWHKRVDIAWYLQKVCGAGKYPAYIYLACGVNDIVDYNWDVNALPAVRADMKLLLGRIKAACDVIAGGSSNVQILLMNHQFYPLNEGSYKRFSPAHQRQIWAEHYDKYEKMVADDTVDSKRLNTYVRFVDCASSFDIDYGYTYVPERANPRNTQTIDTVVDTVHIGESGSAMYADALLRDFLYHECA